MSLERLDAIHRKLTRIIWMLAINIVLLVLAFVLLCRADAKLRDVDQTLPHLENRLS